MRYGFTEQMRWAEGTAPTLDAVAAILVSRILGCTHITRATKADDRNGTDYWAHRKLPLRALSIDLKLRKEDFAFKQPAEDDLALETWSVLEKVVGWTRDPTKRTDFVLWYWRDTGRFCLVAFPPLCFVFARQWVEWRDKYKHRIQDTTEDGLSWQSECVYVPRIVVFESLTRWSCGQFRPS